MEEVKIRPVSMEDAQRLLDIYAYYVENTAITFEYEVPSLDVFQARIAATLKKYPFLAAEIEGKTAGYTYAGPFVGRAAYDWSAETTIYVGAEQRKRGLGKALYKALEECLAAMGVLNLYACIGYPETEDAYLTGNSAAFHAHMGFSQVGRFHKCGYKFGRWYDMIWMEKIIGEHGEIPSAVRKGMWMPGTIL